MVAPVLPSLAMKVVIDTNVFIGACLGRGAANAALVACLHGRCTPLMGSTLLAEYEDVLGRDGLFERSPLDRAEREELLDIFLSVCQWTRVYYSWRPNLRDEGDNHLVELAVAGGARFIVTRNTLDLAHTELRFPGLDAVTPEQWLEEIDR